VGNVDPAHAQRPAGPQTMGVVADSHTQSVRGFSPSASVALAANGADYSAKTPAGEGEGVGD
jgi:hypothetical protein